MENKVYLIQWYDGEEVYHSAIASQVKVALVEGLKTILDTEEESEG